MKTSHSYTSGVRSFDFGRCELSHEKPRDTVPGDGVVILAVYEGAVVVEAGERASRLDARSCALFAGGKSLNVALIEGASAAVLWCNACGQAPAGLLVADALRADGDQLVLSNQIDALLRLGIHVKKKGKEFEEGLRDALGVAVFSTLRSQTDPLSHAPMPSSARKARDYIDMNCERACDLSSLAAVAGVTREHLNVVFRRHVGLTPMRYLWNVRTQKAVRLVQGTDLNLASVAERCGFKSPFHLSREIKRATGQSPRDLRRSGEV